MDCANFITHIQEIVRKKHVEDFLSFGQQSEDTFFDTLAVFGIGTLEVCNLSLADVLLCVLQVTGNVVDQVGLLFRT